MSNIIGLGVDATEIDRIAATIERFGDRFIRRVFTDTEIAYCTRRRVPTIHFAGRFAAKEACAKALGTGIRAGVWWRDIGVVNRPSGQPTMTLTGGALRRLQSLTPPGHQARIDLTISDEGPMAIAYVIISALPVAQAGHSGGPAE